MHDSQVKWKCRKGLRELDILLSKYFEEKYPHLTDEDKLVFLDVVVDEKEHVYPMLEAGMEMSAMWLDKDKKTWEWKE